MSGQQTSFSSSSYSYTSSSSTSNGQTTGYRTSTQSQTGPDGTTVQRSSQNLGEPAVSTTMHYDSQGRQLVDGSSNSSNGTRRIQDVSDEEQAQRDREYEERIEEEYAKREGGA